MDEPLTLERPPKGNAAAPAPAGTSLDPDALDGYLALAEQVRNARLLDRRPWYYGGKIGLTVAALAAGWALFFVVGDSWATLWVACLLAVLFTQVVFLGHDAGHQQIFSSRRANRMVGIVVGDALTGLSFGWWVPKHSAHHAYPNQVDRDPDIGVGPIAFTFTPETAAGRSGVTGFLARHQAWLFFPFLLIEGVGLHVTGVQTMLRRKDRAAVGEVLLMSGHAVLYLTVVFWVLSPLKALAFIGVQQGLFGLYLGCTFAPNHKGMPIIERDERVSFARRQVVTARNVRGGWVTTFMLGGLNYQIEHHLFPMMPRPNLAKAQTMIEAFCVEHALPYHEESLIGSYRQALRHLHAVAGGGGETPPIPR